MNDNINQSLSNIIPADPVIINISSSDSDISREISESDARIDALRSQTPLDSSEGISSINLPKDRNIEVAEESIIERIRKVHQSLLEFKNITTEDLAHLFDFPINEELHEKIPEAAWKELLQALTKNHNMLEYIQRLPPNQAKLILVQLHSFPSVPFSTSLEQLAKQIVFDCIKNHYLELLNLLLVDSEHANVEDEDGLTPLMYAVGTDYSEGVHAIVNAGANLNIQKSGQSLILAAAMGRTESLQVLINAHQATNISLDEVEGEGRTALMCAADQGHIESVKALIHAGASLSIQDLDGLTVLMLAAQAGHIETVRALIQAGANLNTKNQYGETALMVAAKNGQTESLQALIDAHPVAHRLDAINARSTGGSTALMLAAYKGHTETVRALIQAGANLNTKNQHGETALMAAAHYGQTESLQVLIDAHQAVNISLDEVEDEGKTALMHAASQGHIESVKALVHAGASLSIQDTVGFTALMLAADNGQTESLQALIDAHSVADRLDAINARSTGGNTALVLAACKGHIETVRALIQAGANLNTKNQYERTALIRAAHNGQSASLQVLIDAYQAANISLDEVEDEGRTALMHAANQGHIESLRVLIHAGANLSIQDTGGSTAIMLAAGNGHTEGLQALIDAHPAADRLDAINARNPIGITALMFAAASGRTETVRALIQAGADPLLEDARGNTAWDIAMLSGHGTTALELPRRHDITIRLLVNIDSVPEHKILHNKLFLTLNRSNMTPEIAKAQFHLLKDYLFQYQRQRGNFSQLELNIKYQGEEGIDSGGLSREYISQLCTPLLQENPFFSMEKDYMTVFNEHGTNDPENLILCKNFGVFLAAIFSGFPKRVPPVKIGGVFSDRFYSQLLATYKYAQNDPTLLKPFDRMGKEEAENFTKTVSDYDIENILYKNINHNFEKETFTDKELDDILLFLVYDKFQAGDSIDDQLTELLDEECTKIVQQFPKNEDLLKLWSTAQALAFPESLRNTLRTVLNNAVKKTQLKQQFIDSRTDAYANRCIPLSALGEGFLSIASRNKMTPVIEKLIVSSLEATKEFSNEIQGPPFTRDVFIDLLERSILYSSAEHRVGGALSQADAGKLGWLVDWCRGLPIGEDKIVKDEMLQTKDLIEMLEKEPPIAEIVLVTAPDGTETKLLRATEESMQNMLRGFTGTTAIPQQLVLEFKQPTRGMGDFHTCFNYMHPGRVVLDENNIIKFFKSWMSNVDWGLASGFEMA